MSLRHYNSRGNRRKGISFRSQLFLNSLLAISIGLQILYPLLNGEALRLLTLACVYFAASTMVVHSYFAFGLNFAISYLFITFIFALTTEQIGLRTGWPFGHYTYDDSLAYQIYGVPVVVPCAWIMMAYPVLVAARRVTKHWVFLYGGVAMMAWDLFLDPMMVRAHRWSWSFDGPHVPFQPEIPLSNTIGWLLTGTGLIALLHLFLPHDRRKQSVSFLAIDIFLGWTLFSGIIGNLFFFHRSGIALIGGIILGLTLTPYALSRWLGRP